MKVRYTHYRMIDGQDGWTRYEWKEMGRVPDARGGITTCTILLDDGRSTAGVAVCSEKDNYSKKMGRNIAYGRAMKNVEKGLALPPEEIIENLRTYLLEEAA